MNGVIQLFRLDVASWDRVSHMGTMVSAAATSVGAYTFLAFDRFGFQAFVAPRASMRMLLVGFYGWLGLTGLAWLIARRRNLDLPAFGEAFGIYGHAHLPLLLLAFVIQMVAVVVQSLGPSLYFAVFVFGFWMPAALLAATRYLFTTTLRSAALVVIPPYIVWMVVVGGYLFGQVGHLL